MAKGTQFDPDRPRVELDHGDVVELEDTLTRYRRVMSEDHSLELHFRVFGRSDRGDILDLPTPFFLRVNTTRDGCGPNARNADDPARPCPTSRGPCRCCCRGGDGGRGCMSAYQS